MDTNINLDTRIDPRTKARSLFWQGWKITAIAREIGIHASTVQSWKMREAWDKVAPMTRAGEALEARVVQLSALPSLSDSQLTEIERLSKTLSRHYRPRTSSDKAQRPDNSERLNRKNKSGVNHFSEEQTKRLSELLKESMFDYQRTWYEAGQKYRFRNILKARQIGATFYFAREALVDAATTGRNQIFLSASRAQAHQFKGYISDMAAQVDVELNGEKIILSNGATLHFLGTNSRTAQGRTGNLYVDEYFWIPKFQELKRLAQPMASQKHLRTTYFSTPSNEGHEAYPFWTGELFNEGRPQAEHIQIATTHEVLKYGKHCDDGQFRQIVNIEDALANGCNLFDLATLKLEYSPSAFEQLFMCAFMDDGESIFPLASLQNCRVDAWEDWEHFYKPFAIRPLGNMPVWLGYDPSDTGDAAGLVIALPPQFDGDKFRIIETLRLHGNDYETQGGLIKEKLKQYNVAKIVIDAQGLGSSVYQIVKSFFPSVIGIRYTPENKGQMILKTQQLLRTNRLEFAVDNKDFAISFMGIRRTITPKSGQITYTATRNKQSGHSDLAFAAMQLFIEESIDGSVGGKSNLEVIR